MVYGIDSFGGTKQTKVLKMREKGVVEAVVVVVVMMAVDHFFHFLSTVAGAVLRRPQLILWLHRLVQHIL